MREDHQDAIVQRFSYDSKERARSRDIDAYMRRMEPHFGEITCDPQKRRRFMLAGLFLSYRAANHQGLPMSSDPSAGSDVYIDDRLQAFERISGERISSTADYLRLIRFSPLTWRLRGTAASLERFVLAD